MSLGRQPPPKPMPALRKRRPMRASCPIAVGEVVDVGAGRPRTTSAMALMKEILVARNALAATLTSSAVAHVGGPGPGVPRSAYTSRSRSRAGIGSFAGRATPTTSRSGSRVSLHGEALPEELGVPQHGRGADRQSARRSREAYARCRPGRSTCRRAASGGTRSRAPSESIAPTRRTGRRRPRPASCGVPTQRKCRSPTPPASAKDVGEAQPPGGDVARQQLVRGPARGRGPGPRRGPAAWRRRPRRREPRGRSSAMHAAWVAPR